ncbi:MAG: divergent polysaccharide deacetylase family protein [Pikeienuella sp.]
MAGSNSGRGAYFLGAVFGLFISVAVVGALSVYAPTQATVPDVTQNTSAQPVTPSPTAATTPSPAVENEPAPVPVVTQPVVTNPPSTTTVTGAASSAQPTPSIASPQNSTQTPAPTVQPAPDTTPAQALAPGEPASNALIQYGELYDGDPNEPVLAIILDGVGANGRPTDELFLLPAPLTISIDSGSADLRSLVADTRRSGFEAIASIAEFNGATPDEIAARAAVTLDRMGEVIGVAAPAGSLANVTEINGLLTALGPRGMAIIDASVDIASPIFRTAKQANLPAAAVGRRFDEITSSAMVFQALERAAFDAQRTGAYVVVGRADPSIITGLRRWLNVKAGKSVKIAPLSEVVRRLQR